METAGGEAVVGSPPPATGRALPPRPDGQNPAPAQIPPWKKPKPAAKNAADAAPAATDDKLADAAPVGSPPADQSPATQAAGQGKVAPALPKARTVNPGAAPPAGLAPATGSEPTATSTEEPPPAARDTARVTASGEARPCSMSGVLLRGKPGSKKKWIELWGVLKNSVLYFHEKEGSETPLESTLLLSYTVIQDETDPVGFTLRHAGLADVYLRAASEITRTMWVQLLTAAAGGQHLGFASTDVPMPVRRPSAADTLVTPVPAGKKTLTRNKSFETRRNEPEADKRGNYLSDGEDGPAPKHSFTMMPATEASITPNSGVLALVFGLSQGTPETKTLALKYLNDWCQINKQRDKGEVAQIRKLNGIPHLAAVLASNSIPEAVGHALDIVDVICANDPLSGPALFNGDLLGKVLASTALGPPANLQALQMMIRLVQHPAARISLGTQDAFPVLVSLLKSPDPEVVRLGLEVLGALCSNDPAGLKQLRKADGIPAIVQLMIKPESPAPIAVAAMQCIAEAVSDTAVTRELRTVPCLDPLLTIAERGLAPAHHGAWVVVLDSITAPVHDSVAGEGAIKVVLGALAQPDARVRAYALKIVRERCAAAQHVPGQFREAGCLSAVVDLLANGSEDSQRHAVWALGKCCEMDKESVPKVRQLGGLRLLLLALQNSNDVIQTHAAWAVAECCRHPSDGRACIRVLHAGHHAGELLKALLSTNPKLQRAAAAAVTASAAPQHAYHYIRAGVLEIYYQFVDSGNNPEARESLAAVYKTLLQFAMDHVHLLQSLVTDSSAAASERARVLTLLLAAFTEKRISTLEEVFHDLVSTSDVFQLIHNALDEAVATAAVEPPAAAYLVRSLYKILQPDLTPSKVDPSLPFSFNNPSSNPDLRFEPENGSVFFSCHKKVLLESELSRYFEPILRDGSTRLVSDQATFVARRALARFVYMLPLEGSCGADDLNTILDASSGVGVFALGFETLDRIRTKLSLPALLAATSRSGDLGTHWAAARLPAVWQAAQQAGGVGAESLGAVRQRVSGVLQKMATDWLERETNIAAE